MSRLNLVTPETANGKQRELLDALIGKFGKIPLLMQAITNSTATMDSYITLFENLSEGRFSHQFSRKIGLTIGEENGCEYCISLLATVAKLQNLSEEDIKLARQAQSTDAKEQVLLDFLIILMRNKGDVTNEEIQVVKNAGWEDGDIAELFGHMILNFLTNYAWKVTRTNIDYPPLRIFDQSKMNRGATYPVKNVV